MGFLCNDKHKSVVMSFLIAKGLCRIYLQDMCCCTLHREGAFVADRGSRPSSWRRLQTIEAQKACVVIRQSSVCRGKSAQSSSLVPSRQESF